MVSVENQDVQFILPSVRTRWLPPVKGELLLLLDADTAVSASGRIHTAPVSRAVAPGTARRLGASLVWVASFACARPTTAFSVAAALGAGLAKVTATALVA